MTEDRGQLNSNLLAVLSRRQALAGLWGVAASVTLAACSDSNDGGAITGSPAPTSQPGSLATPAKLPTYESTPLDQIRSSLPQTSELIQQATAARTGGQIYASIKGKRVIDFAWTGAGNTRNESLVSWASACKPTTCTTVLQLWEQGVLGLDDRTTKYIPEFAAGGKEEVTLRHLLTHSAHLGGYGGPINLPSWDQTVAAIVQAPRELTARAANGGRTTSPPPPLGTQPTYNPAGIWILAEIVRRHYKKDFWEVVREHVYVPAGMADSWNGMPPQQVRDYGDRIAAGAGRIAAPAIREENALRTNPAGGAVGPSRELARFYEMLLGAGEVGGVRLLKAASVAEMVKLQATDGGIWTWGLGLNLNIKPTRAQDLNEDANDPTAQALRYGSRASEAAFGHNGASGMIAFADPKHGLAFAMIGVGTRLVDALYDDLNLV